MLLNLTIRNYALIDEARLEPGDGLTVFTGETGAGKSIIIESIGLLLGERASAQAVRKGTDRCFITGEFDISRVKDLDRFLEEAGIPSEGETSLIVRREIDSQGRSRALVNDRPVSISTLAAIGSFLVDIHGQHEHQSLFHTENQRALLDRYAGAEELAARVAGAYRQWQELLAFKESQLMSAQERERRIDLYSFQLKEIDGAHPVPGEEEELEHALPQLKNAEKLQAVADEAYQILYSSDSAVLDNLRRVDKLLAQMASLGASFTDTAASLADSLAGIEEAARDIENFRDHISADPEQLNELLERQDTLHRLKRKYGATIQEILAYRGRIAGELAALNASDDRLKELDRNIATARRALDGLCSQLTALREKAGQKLARLVEKELDTLGMKKARFSVAREALPEPVSFGADRIAFLFSANPGEDLQPLKAIASGGEMSRVMLGLKTVLANADRVPLLIFDEIDTGIGGPMGKVVGRKLEELSDHHQVLCITHLPQIAACGEHQFYVSKATKGNHTRTIVSPLSPQDRREEIARMLSGDEITDTARRHADELLKGR